MASDPKPPPRIRDPDLMRTLHADPYKACALCGTSMGKLDLHHVLPKGGANQGDDVRENLIFLCQEEHHYITLNYPEARRALGQYLLNHRPDTLAYLEMRLGLDAGRDWLCRRLFVCA